MSPIKSFNFAPGMTLRALQRAGCFWFVAADACNALGMSLASGTGQWTAGLKEHEKSVLQRRDWEFPSLFAGTSNRIAIISESGLYKLVMRSSKPGAAAFQNWVTEVVLPSIRKTGAYVEAQGCRPGRRRPTPSFRRSCGAAATEVTITPSRLPAEPVVIENR